MKNFKNEECASERGDIQDGSNHHLCIYEKMYIIKEKYVFELIFA